MTERTVILHYHLFKNAGTSFDAVLRQNFGDRWATAEFPGGGNNTEKVADWIQSHPDVIAFSSHTAMGPVPVIEGVRVVSCLFLRDPIARIRSAYQFERRQAPSPSGDARGVELARATDFEGYVRSRLAVPGDRQCRDFHVARLSAFVPEAEPDLSRAKKALTLLSFVGQVENFAGSMQRFATYIKPYHPGFNPKFAHLNRSDMEEPVVISDEFLASLKLNNALDYDLLRHARATVWKV